MKNHDTSWGQVAGWYDELLQGRTDTYQAKVILPNLLRLVAPHPGLKVLDLACGQGFFSRALAGAGAEVWGVDVAPELIALAKTASPPTIKYQVGSADRLTVLADNFFDTVVMVLALPNIKNISGALAEGARVLKPGGRAVVVLSHPAFRVPQASAWGWDEAAKTQYRRVDRYLSEAAVAIDMHPGGSKKIITTTFHRSLQVYVKAFVKAGFLVTGLEEWISHKQSQRGPRAQAEDRARKEFPLFLAVTLIKQK